jgi:hypothetical protein
MITKTVPTANRPRKLDPAGRPEELFYKANQFRFEGGSIR